MKDDEIVEVVGHTIAEAVIAKWRNGSHGGEFNYVEVSNHFLAALRAHGMEVVPVEPTEAMQNAMVEAVRDGITINDDVHRTTRHAYRAMITAATPTAGK